MSILYLKNKKRNRGWSFEDNLLKIFFKNGSIKIEGEAFRNEQGKWQFKGKYKQFWTNGKIKLEGIIENRKFVGQWRRFNRLGVAIGIYDSDTLLGKNEEDYFMGKSW